MVHNVKGVLFDFNGTMVFDSPQHKKAWDVFSKKYRGIDISEEEMEQMHGRTNKTIIELLLKDSVSDEENEQLSKDKEALYREICTNLKDDYHLVEGLEEVLDELKARNIPMTICSASIKENIEFFIQRFQLGRWFCIDNIIYDDGTHANKISMFQDGAKAIQVPVEECLIIEDSLSGIKYAHAVHAANIIAITSLDKIEEYQELAGVNQVITDYRSFDMSIFKE
ncbi:HAD family hydrolase [Amedibacillus sp. YH-ame10]